MKLVSSRRARGAHVRVFAVVLVWAAAGCGSGFRLSVPGAPKDCRRIAAGPAVVSVFEFEASGGLKQRSDWTYDASQTVDAAVAARVKRGGGRTFVPADVAHTDVTSDDFRHWGSAALQEIAGTIAKTRSSAHQSVADWRFPQSLSTWRAALGADAVLILLFVDAYEPAAPAGTGSSSATSSGTTRPRPASPVWWTPATAVSSRAERPRAGSAISGRAKRLVTP